jgi:NOL1/NOP2/fmu family ribosome biogenesis protein
MRAVRQSLERLGIVNVATVVHDGANFPNSAGLFDRVLVDVPCSCQGTVRRDKKVVARADLEFSSRKVGLQKALLRRAVELCKPGGRIVYATCTYPPEENEVVADAVLREYGGAVQLRPAHIDDFESSPGLTAWNGQQFDSSLANTMRVWPQQNDTGGFFIAVLEKIGDDLGSGEMNPRTNTFDADNEYLQIVVDRFGIPPEHFQNYRLFEPGGGKLYLVNHDHQAPIAPQPDAEGMLFMRIRVRYPKLTTAAALLFGDAATRNYVDVDDRQAKAYTSRQNFEMSNEQRQHCTDVGYILIRHRGYTLGVGLYYPRENGGVVESMFPKGWSPVK